MKIITIFKNLKYLKQYMVLRQLFDKDYYLDMNPDIQGYNPLLHYIRCGWKEGRNPNRLFLTNEYLQANPDVKQANINPLYHYITKGIKENRSLTLNYYKCEWDFYVLAKSVLNHGGKVYLKDRLYDLNCKPSSKILLVSHELSTTGAPIVLLEAVKLMQKHSVSLTIVSPTDGPLTSVIEGLGIPLLIIPDLMTNYPFLSCAKLFDAVFANTLETFPIIKQLNGTDIPTVWWLHEPIHNYDCCSLKTMPSRLTDNIKVIAVSPIAKNALSLFFPLINSSECWFGISPVKIFHEYSPFKKNKIVFSLVGTIHPIKGQIVLSEVCSLLSEEEKDKIEFRLIGQYNRSPKKYVQQVMKMCENNPCIKYVGYFPKELMSQQFEETDCLLCISKMEAGPTVVVEALSCGIPVICSRYAAVARMLEQYHAGFITDLTPDDIVCKIRKVLNQDMTEMIGNGKELYNQVFSLDAFNNRLIPVLDWLFTSQTQTPNGKLSIIIPTWNGEKTLPRLLNSIASQKGIGELEIVAVDSGSTDNTIEILKKYGVRIVQIPHECFSHGYARNVGADCTTGDYLLFTVQNAEMSDPYHLRKMLNQLVQHGDCAVSCLQRAYSDSDLFGRLQIVQYNNWLTSSHLTELKIAGLQDTPEIHRLKIANGDVCNLLPRNLFQKYRFQRDYAEDIDLTERILSDGYPVIMMTGLHVNHSHNRPAWYHLRRAIYDRKIENIYKHGEADIITNAQETLQRIADIALSCVTQLDSSITKENAIHELQKIKDQDMQQVAIDAVKACENWQVCSEHANSVLQYKEYASRYLQEFPDVYEKNDTSLLLIDALEKQSGTAIGQTLGTCSDEVLSKNTTLRELYNRCHCNV